jgi:hypothetical protein
MVLILRIKELTVIREVIQGEIGLQSRIYNSAKQKNVAH